MRAVRRAGIGLVALCALLGGRGPVRAQQTNGGGFVPLRADGNGVPALRRTVTLRHDATPLGDVLRGIMRAADLELVFRADLPDLERAITVHQEDITAAAALLRVLDGTRLRVVVSGRGQAVLVEAAEPRAREADGVISGAVREAGGAPIGFAEVALRGTGRSVAADAGGRFRLRGVPPGEYEVVARRLGYREASIAGVRVGAGGEAVVQLALDAAPTPLAAVIVTPGHFGMLEQSVASRQSLSREEIETKPQIGDDIFRAVNRIPGVNSYDLSAAFGVRGGAHRELFVRLDGLELLEPFHLKDFEGAISIVDLGSIGGVDLITGGFGAEYGNRLTGVFDMRTSAVAPGGARTSLGLSLTNVRAGTQGAFATDRGRWLFTARRGYLDLALELGNGNTALSPRYYDVLGKVEYELSPRAVLSAHLLHAGDRLSYDDDEPREPTLESTYTSSYAWVNLEASPADRLSSLTVLSVGRLDWERDGDRLRDPRRFGGLAVHDTRWFEFAGLRQDWTYEVGERWLMKAGFDAKSASADYDYFGWHEDWVVSNGQVVARFDTVRASAAPAGTMLGAYLSQRVQPWRPLTLELGAEWSRQSYTDEDHVNPRVNVALSAGRTTLRGAWGRYAQAQGLHELQVQDGVDRFFPAEHAEHRVLSVEHGLPSGVELRAELYERRTDDLRPRFINFDHTDDSFPEVTPSRHRIDPDEGRARGLELLARKRGGRFDWTASYTRASVTERFGAAWEPAQRDQRHSVGLDLTYSPDPRWRLAAAWTWHAGWPYTPHVVRADSVANGGWFFTWEYPDYNAARLPAYHRMDVRVSRLFETRRGRVSVFLDVWNLYDRENARGIFTNVIGIRNGEPITATVIDGVIPRLPSFGIFWEF